MGLTLALVGLRDGAGWRHLFTWLGLVLNALLLFAAGSNVVIQLAA